MNPLFYPHVRESKSGLNKTRRIIKCSSDVQERDIRKSIPDNWFYNSNGADRFWEELEKYEQKQKLEQERRDQNAFEQIDESAQRIRKMIDRFEVSDREFIVALMEMLDADEAASDQTDMLIEARFKLSQLIEDHAGNSDAQGKMLDSLKFWFNNLIQESEENISQGVSDLMSGSVSFDAAELANMINHSFEMREMSTEQIEDLHRSVVDELTKKIRNMSKVIKEQQNLIDDLQRVVDGYASRRKKQAEKEKMLDSARKKLYEQEGAMANLRKAITGLKEDLNTARSLAEEKPQPEPKSEAVEQLEIELQCDQKLAVLESTIRAMQMDINGHLATIRKHKQNEALLEDKIQSLERGKKGLEQSLLFANQKMKMAEENYKKQIEEIEGSAKEKASQEAASQTRLFYEQQMHELREQERQRMNDLREDLDKRYRAQLAKITQAIQDKDQSKLLTELNNRGAEQLEAMKEQFQKQIKEMQDASGHKITMLTKHYERKNRALLDEQQRVQASTDRSISQATKTEKMALEEEYSQKLIQYQDKATNDLAELRSRFAAKYEKMASKMQQLEKERNALKSVIEAANISGDLFEEDAAEEDEHDDNVLNDSLIELKQREIEQQVSAKYTAILKAQREVFSNQKQWEYELLKQGMKHEAEEMFAKLRSEVMHKLCSAREAITKDPNTTPAELEQLMVTTLNSVAESDSALSTAREKPLAIPLPEVESRLEQLTKKVTDLTGENEFLRMTLAELNNGQDLKGKDQEDLIRAMRTAVAEQAQKMTETMKEYNTMKTKLAAYEAREKEKGLTETEVQVTPEPAIWCSMRATICSMEDTSKPYQDNAVEPTVILRDLRPPNPRQRPTKLNASAPTSDVSVQTEPRRLRRRGDGSSTVEAMEYEEDLTEPVSGMGQRHQRRGESSAMETSKALVFSHQPESQLANLPASLPTVSYGRSEAKSANVTCSHCKNVVNIDPNIWSVCETVDPCIECSHCHSTIVIPRQMVRGNAGIELEGLSEEQREQINALEKQIQQQIHDLIEMKRKMQDTASDASGRVSNRPSDAHSGVSIKSFTGQSDSRGFTDEQWAEIAEAEQSINKNIQALLELKRSFAKKYKWEIGGLHEISISRDEEEKSFKEAFIVQSLASMEISGTGQLDAVESTVRTLTDMDALHSPIAQQTAIKIAETARSLKHTDAEPEVVESLVKSTKHLLMSLHTFEVAPEEDEGNDIESLLSENQRFKAGITVIKEKQHALSEEFSDIRNLTRELKKKHEEIVAFLTGTLQKVVNAMQKNGAGDKEALKALKEHTEYLTKALIEKEASDKNIEEVDQILREREMEMLGIKHEMMQKNSDVELLTQHCAELASTVEQLQLKLSAAESNLAAVQFNSNQQTTETEALVAELNESKVHSNELQAKLDAIELKCHELANKLVMKESENPIEYSIVSPFVVFDTVIPDLPPRGVSLVPGVVDRPRVTQNQERIRVKVGQSTAKIVLPASKTIGKGRISVPAPNVKFGYTELVPTRTEDPNTVMYVKKQVDPDPSDLQTASRITHYDHQPVRASVVVQKTIQNFRKRLQMMEIALQDKSRELLETRDRHLKIRTLLTKAQIDQQKAERLVRRSTIECEILKEKLEAAYALIAQRDEEIRELRKLLREITEGHGQIVMHSMIDKFAKDGSNVVAMREFRHQAFVNEIKSTYSISPWLRQLAERQMATVSRWEARRNEIQERQRRNLLAVLQGLNLVHEPPRPEIDESLKPNTPRKVVRGTIRITHFGPADADGNTYTERYRRKKYINTRPLFDRALVTLAARKQKLEPRLRKGVIGTHVKT